MSTVPFTRQTREADDVRVKHGLTDVRWAEAFAAEYGDILRYDTARGAWRYFDGVRWKLDSGAAVTIAAEFAKERQREALNISDRAEREAVVRACIQREDKRQIDNALAIARCVPPLKDAGTWDGDPWLLGVPNGVLDLRSGTLRAATPEDRLTMIAGVPFDPDADCPRFQRFVREVLDENDALVNFLQKAIGYSLTGLTTEQIVILLQGSGANGKSTLLDIVLDVWGDYAMNAAFSTFEFHQRQAIPHDVAALAGRRFVAALETNDGTRLNESRIKHLSGDRRVTARFLHGEFFEFEPKLKLWLGVNHLPIVRDDSNGFWRRVRLIPFNRTFEVDPTLGDRLREEAQGILAWAVRGCLRWQSEGLRAPDVVLSATADYREASDPFGEFIVGACEVNEHAQVGAADLYAHYAAWASRQGLSERQRFQPNQFGRKAAERFTRVKTRTGWVYMGLARRW